MKDPNQQDVVRDLHEYKEELRKIQLAVIELIQKIDFDTYRRDRLND